MLFSSAYAAMMGLIPPLVTERTAVISDALNHNCKRRNNASFGLDPKQMQRLRLG